MIQAAQWQPSGSLLAPVFQSLIDGVPNSTSTNSNAPTVTFPVEEVSFGRDITIDGLYISLMGNVTETTTLNFNFNGIAFGSLVLAAGSLNMTTPTEFQVFPSSVTTSGAFTVHSPQLSVTVPQYLDAGVSQLYIVKIAEFGSFDPKQRPV
jgi:hypothetical protein